MYGKQVCCATPWRKRPPREFDAGRQPHTTGPQKKETSHVGPIDDVYKLDDESATRKIVDHILNTLDEEGGRGKKMKRMLCRLTT